ncbi:putative membrane protein [Waddlia chondrophila 2032/99]|uniref:Putative membrane protein n=2 Tax=Waddlia chondrophila TaxID=71667 RepID=D6YVQ8_WADCW|nr:hypothetical protein [Waddlia chondrophila]ADI38219.1 putative membrane protein [Waddlia chondrophila WSU 86-1044]CCB90350.1 putative membrane protein [Waddlia chondrophila 2032/99]
MMKYQEIGREALKYAFNGLAGFGVGVLLGKALQGPSMIVGGILAIGFVALKALRTLVRNFAIRQDMHLSNYQIVKNITGTVLNLAVNAALYAFGIFGTNSFMVISGASLAVCALNIGLGLYIKYSEQDELMSDIVVGEKSPWYLHNAYA